MIKYHLTRQRAGTSLLFVFLLTFPFYLSYQLYYLDKVFFFCPVEYRQDTIIIRHDSYGSGDFLSNRSGNRKHNGIDLQAKLGAAVYAVRTGKVIKARFHPALSYPGESLYGGKGGVHRGMGNLIEILHSSGGYVTIYGHLSKIEVRAGQLVRQGQKIGAVGKTGNANHRGVIPHLHFEIRKNGMPLDPMKFIE